MSARRTAIVVMGVAGSGKSTVGAVLARALGLPFVEGDALHGEANIAKMRAGEPLTDSDRAPWLAAIGGVLADEARFPRGVVVACSALKVRYRDTLRTRAGSTRFLFLDLPPALAATRVRQRHGHFMPAKLIPSQFAALEHPSQSETDVTRLDASAPVATLVECAVAALARDPRG